MIKHSASEKQLLIFTDLDGTLLDHHSYSFAAAQAALTLIAAQRIPLIINSSKTFAEIVAIQQALNICQPFISENGAAVYRPLNEVASADPQHWQRQSFAVSRSEVLSVLQQLRSEHGYQFCGFADGDVTDIVRLTGLGINAAELAGRRDYSEPLQWQGSEVERRAFLQQLAENKLAAQQGGRFLTVMSQSVDKAIAMRWLAQRYRDHRRQCIIALGDSPNDEPMLNAADIAVVIKSARSGAMQVSGPQQVMRTELPGPAGWQWAMDQLLAAYDNTH